MVISSFRCCLFAGFLLALLSPSGVEAQSVETDERDEVIDLRPRVRILSPKAGMIAGDDVEVLVSGPAGDVVEIYADGVLVLRGQFGSNGLVEAPDVRFRDGIGELEIEAVARPEADPESSRVVVRRTPRWVGNPDRGRSTGFSLAFGLAALLPIVATVGSMIVLEEVRGARWYDVWTVSALYMGATSIPLAVAAPGTSREVSPWVAVLVSTASTALFVGAGELLRNNGERGMSTLVMFGSVLLIPTVSIGSATLLSSPARPQPTEPQY